MTRADSIVIAIGSCDGPRLRTSERQWLKKSYCSILAMQTAAWTIQLNATMLWCPTRGSVCPQTTQLIATHNVVPAPRLE
jgi:hypothetical protein